MDGLSGLPEASRRRDDRQEISAAQCAVPTVAEFPAADPGDFSLQNFPLMGD